jgi:hypothetical protein
MPVDLGKSTRLAIGIKLMIVRFNLESTVHSAEMELLRALYRYLRPSLFSWLRQPKKGGPGSLDEFHSWTTCLRGDHRTDRSHLMMMVCLTSFLLTKLTY